MDLATIDAIIFDLGGVIINIDYLRTILEFNALHDEQVDFPFSQDDQADLFDAFEKGEVSSSTFRRELRRILDIHCDDQSLDKAWNAMLLDIPPERIKLIETLSTRKRLFLLSNTNAIHKSAFDQMFQADWGSQYQKIDTLFEKTYYSHLVGDRKPNLSIFQKLIDENNLKPQRTLLLDSHTVNAKSAAQLGIKTYTPDHSHTLMDLAWLNEIQ